MKELSLHILDIATNSVRGKSTNITIKVHENLKENQFIFSIDDDGTGIPKEIFDSIKNPFTTSRTVRKVGLGIPLLNDTCKMCSGSLTLHTEEGVGTKIVATMVYTHIDRPPLGDIVSTIVNLMTTYEDINVSYVHHYNENSFSMSTKEIKGHLGNVSLAELEIVLWLKEYLKENIEELKRLS